MKWWGEGMVRTWRKGSPKESCTGPRGGGGGGGTVHVSAELDAYSFMKPGVVVGLAGIPLQYYSGVHYNSSPQGPDMAQHGLCDWYTAFQLVRYCIEMV